MLRDVFDWLSDLMNAERLQTLIAEHGLWVMTPVMFAETGLLVGFFLPGDSLLFLAGAVAATTGKLDPWLAILCLGLAAIAGNTLNYWLGRWLGGWLMRRPDGRILKRKHLEDAHQFYERWGALSLVLTRYIPILRTFVPFVAGTARMDFSRFMLWNVVGAVAWVPVLIGLGWWLGSQEFVKKHIESIIIGVIVVSLMPVVIAGLLKWRAQRKALATHQDAAP